LCRQTQKWLWLEGWRLLVSRIGAFPSSCHSRTNERKEGSQKKEGRMKRILVDCPGVPNISENMVLVAHGFVTVLKAWVPESYRHIERPEVCHEIGENNTYLLFRGPVSDVQAEIVC
jgi:hypothetical protein